MKCCCKSCKSIQHFLHLCFTLKGYVPSNLYTTDFRLLFILTAIYTSLVTQLRQAGNQEAEEDIVSGRLFRVNSMWTNHSVTGGVSDRVLWNCRTNSETSAYYKSLYLGLIIFLCIVIFAYFIVSMIINALVAFEVSKINFEKKNNGKKVNYLEEVANEVKRTLRLRHNIKTLKSKWLVKENRNEVKVEIDAIVQEWKCKKTKLENNKHFYNWFTVLYIIPRIETTIMLCILMLALSSYDIHPIGCLSPIDVSYNEEDSSAILNLSDNVIRYQRGSAILIILLFILWFCVKLAQFFLIPRIHWGIQIDKVDNKRYGFWPWICSFNYVRAIKSYNFESQMNNEIRDQVQFKEV